MTGSSSLPARRDPLIVPIFDELVVGQCLRAGPRQITAGDIDAFAKLTGDHHRLHRDDEWAAQSPFGRKIAHGLLVISCAAGLLSRDSPRIIALRSIDALRFKRPVGAGDAIVVDARVTKLSPLSETAGLVHMRLRVSGDHTFATALIGVVWACA